jgi:hypothetical protein
MSLFKSDLYRNFAIGFALGAGVVAWQVAPAMAHDLHSQAPAPAAQAAK